MRQFLSLSTFHLKLFARNGYFVSTMLTSTLGMLLLQYVIAYAAHTLSDPFLWVRAGIFKGRCPICSTTLFRTRCLWRRC